jgi:AcrB/AcrD/AcrF family
MFLTRLHRRPYRAYTGHEIEHPMAIVILGGLVTSTLLNLLVLPTLYLRFGRRRGETAAALSTANRRTSRGGCIRPSSRRTVRES